VAWGLALVLGMGLGLAACNPNAAPGPAVESPGSTARAGESPSGVGRSDALPPIPTIPRESLGPGQPPLIWVGGTLSEVAADGLQVTEGVGSVVTLKRLARGATVFYRVSGAAWRPLAPVAKVSAGQLACVETLLDGANLLALRVFLGADCGPA